MQTLKLASYCKTMSQYHTTGQGTYYELFPVLGYHAVDEDLRRRDGALRHGEDGDEVVIDEVVGAHRDREECAPEPAHRRHLPAPRDHVLPVVGVVVDLGIQVYTPTLSNTTHAEIRI